MLQQCLVLFFTRQEGVEHGLMMQMHTTMKSRLPFLSTKLFTKGTGDLRFKPTVISTTSIGMGFEVELQSTEHVIWQRQLLFCCIYRRKQSLGSNSLSHSFEARLLQGWWVSCKDKP